MSISNIVNKYIYESSSKFDKNKVYVIATHTNPGMSFSRLVDTFKTKSDDAYKAARKYSVENNTPCRVLYGHELTKSEIKSLFR